ncbi:MAG TPA: dethiobiotin synthase [Baekduia sp.]|nr:dethiobiotin synthase [Baekduia sp.]
MSRRGLFVTGTDTAAGKTVLAAALCATLAARGIRVAASKPVLSGLADPGPHDHEVLAACTGQRPQDVSPTRFDPPVSPHLAAEQEGVVLDVGRLAADARRAGAHAEALVVEGVGGLLVPLGPHASVRDLAAELHLPLVVAARPGLGTINHTLLTLEAARAGGLEVRAVVLTPWDGADAIALSNRETIAELGRVAVHVLPATGLDPAALAAAGAELPVEDWLG